MVGFGAEKEVIVVVMGVDWVLVWPVGFTAENCFRTWDSEELAVWWWKIGTAC